MNPAPVDERERKRTRQRRIVASLGTLLIVAGLLVLGVLHRLPLPMRIMAGLGDIFIGAVLLVLVRQDAIASRR